MASYLYWILSPISNYTRSYFQPQTIVTQPTLIVAQNILSAPPAESASIDKKNWTKGDSAIPDDVLLKAGLPFDKEQPLELIIHQLQPLVETGSISKHQMLEIIIHHAALQNVDSVLNDNLNALFELDTPNDVTTGYIHCFLKKCLKNNSCPPGLISSILKHPIFVNRYLHSYESNEKKLVMFYNPSEIAILLKEGLQSTSEQITVFFDLAMQTQSIPLLDALLTKEIPYLAKTPLLHKCVHYTLRKKNAESLRMVQMVLESGSDPNITDDDEYTPLQLASLDPYYPLIQLFLEHEAEATGLITSSGMPLLHLAFKKDHSLFDLLLEKGAEINIEDQSGQTLFQKAALKPSLKQINRLLQIKKLQIVNVKTRSGYSLLHWAFDNDRSLFRALLAKGASLNEIEYNKRPFLHNILTINPLCIAQTKELIALGADVNAIDNKGNTALFYLIGTQNIPLFIYFLEKGGNIFARNNEGDTVLSKLILKWSEDQILKLIKKILKHFSIPLKAPSAPFDVHKWCQEQDFDKPASYIPSFLFGYARYTQKGFSTLTAHQLEDLILSMRKSLSFIPLQVYIDHFVMVDSVNLKKAGESLAISPAPDVDFSELVTMFKDINFTDPAKPGYRNPNAIYEDERKKVTPERLLNELERLVKNIQDNTNEAFIAVDGIEEHYVKLTKLIKHITKMLKEMADPDRKTSYLIDLAIARIHCAKRPMGELLDMYYTIKAGGIHPTLDDQFSGELREFRHELVKILCKGEVHSVLKYLKEIGPDIGIIHQDEVVQQRDCMVEGITKEIAWGNFIWYYFPSRVYLFTQNFLLERLNGPKGEWIHQWIRDHMPENWHLIWLDDSNPAQKAMKTHYAKLKRTIIDIKAKTKNNPSGELRQMKALLKEYRLNPTVENQPPETTLKIHEAYDYIDTAFLDMESGKLKPTAPLLFLLQTDNFTGITNTLTFSRLAKLFQTFNIAN